jgi:poly(hydroxyalkanoate) depolymerase family esterase
LNNVKKWRLPLVFPAGKTPIVPEGSSSHRSALKDLIARSMPSSGVQLPRDHDIGRVIAKALSSAGLESTATASPSAFVGGPGSLYPQGNPGWTTRRQARAADGPCMEAGRFLSGAFQNPAGTRNYKLYIPSGYATGTTAMPLIVMLHGCTQSADDFAAGTQMNRLAEREGFLVLYPEQSANANGSNCWNWFRADDQQREQGEPSLLAGLTCRIVSTYRIDPARVFVAGLSAGAAMAVILGVTHPDVFAAVGAHSGLAYGAARDVPSACAAMKGGAAPTRKGATSGTRMRGGSRSRQASGRPAVPTIVFHGDGDRTVDCGNGAEIVHQAVEAHGGGLLQARERSLYGQRDCSRFVYGDRADRPVVEHWIVHGAGHAWSGGDARGSYVDASGPSASVEMLRFFLSQRPAATT